MAADRAKKSQSPQVPKGCWCQEPVTAGDGRQNRFYRNNVKPIFFVKVSLPLSWLIQIF